MMQLNYLSLWLSPFLIGAFAASVPTDIPRWANNKVEVLSELIETASTHVSGDMIVVASQNVHNEDGSLKQIRTVEMIVPNMMYRKKSDDPENYLDKLKKNDDELEDTFQKMQHDFRLTFEHEHLDRQGGYQKLSDTGDVELEIYVSKDEILYQDLEGVAYYDVENITRSDKLTLAAEFKQHFESKPNTTIVSSMVWDENGKFDNDYSKVDPKLLAQVDEASDTADEDMIDTALTAVSYSALKHPDEVPKEMSAMMSQKYPDYTWIVTHWHEEDVTSANHDVFIKVTYHNIDLGEDYLEYTLYGVKK